MLGKCASHWKGLYFTVIIIRCIAAAIVAGFLYDFWGLTAALPTEEENRETICFTNSEGEEIPCWFPLFGLVGITITPLVFLIPIDILFMCKPNNLTSALVLAINYLVAVLFFISDSLFADPTIKDGNTSWQRLDQPDLSTYLGVYMLCLSVDVTIIVSCAYKKRKQDEEFSQSFEAIDLHI